MPNTPNEVISIIMRYIDSYGWRHDLVRDLVNRMFRTSYSTQEIEQIYQEHL